MRHLRASDEREAGLRGNSEQLLEPVAVLLLHRPADGEAVQNAAVVLEEFGGVDGVLLDVRGHRVRRAGHAPLQLERLVDVAAEAGTAERQRLDDARRVRLGAGTVQAAHGNIQPGHGRQHVAEAFQLVGTVRDGGALLDAADRLKPDVIVADISMPGTDGVTAMKRIRERLPHTRVILLTNYGDARLVRHALDAGASGFLLKVHAQTELVYAIHTVVNGGTYVSRTIPV